MKFCQSHWDKLRAAIELRGIGHLGAQSGPEAVERAKQELAGAATDATYDPLMSCHWMITGRALEMGGLYLMGPTPDGGEYCPVCEVIAHTPAERASKEEVETNWIDGPADAALAYCREKGLVKA